MKNNTLNQKAKIIYVQDKAIYQLDDNFYQYENYSQRFVTVIDALTWGKAMDRAVKQRAEALIKIKGLETSDLIVAE
jgi:hypothetical protein